MKLSNVSYNRVVKDNLRRTVIRYVVAVGAVFLITIFFRRIHVNNPTTVALTFLLTVLIVSTVWGLRVSVFMAVVATLAFNYYFLPPFGTFTIADPQNWIALFAFLVTAVVASQLSASARQRAVEAMRRQQEMERLYELSRALMLVDKQSAITGQISQRISQVFDVESAAVFDRRTDQ